MPSVIVKQPFKSSTEKRSNLSTEAKQQQEKGQRQKQQSPQPRLDWRRSKVLELSSQGYSEREISEVLKVSDSAVHRDLVFIRRQAKENLQKHIDERIPEEYEKCNAGMNNVLKMTSSIANTVADPRTKLQALSLMNDCYKYKMDESNLCEVSIDGGRENILTKMTMCVVANGKYLGGGLMAAPKASVSDGLLDIVILKDSGGLKMLDYFVDIKDGDYANEHDILYRQAKKVSIKSKERDITVAIDGEPVGILPATFEILKDALTIRR